MQHQEARVADTLWMIVGGESGHGARPMEASWVASLQDQYRTFPSSSNKWGGVQKKSFRLQTMPLRHGWRVSIFPVHVLYIFIRIGNITGFTNGIHLASDFYKTLVLPYKIASDRRRVVERNHQCAFSVAILFK
jgi:hypothetical protein